MLAYNQFSGNSSLQGPGLGGFGRKGAQKIVILETDGMANQASGAATVQRRRLPVVLHDPPGRYRDRQRRRSGPGRHQCRHQHLRARLQHQRRPARLCHRAHAGARSSRIAFGAIFEPTASGSEASRPSRSCNSFRRSAARFSRVRRPIRRTATNGASARLPSGKPSCSKPSSTSWKTPSPWCW